MADSLEVKELLKTIENLKELLESKNDEIKILNELNDRYSEVIRAICQGN